MRVYNSLLHEDAMSDVIHQDIHKLHATMTPSFQESENTVERTNLSLIHEIRRKCLRDRWYGGSLDDPKWLPGRNEDLRMTGFAFPPATEAQLQVTVQACVG